MKNLPKINLNWTELCSLDDGVELCWKINQISPKFGCCPALTGGVLLKIGYRKDIDIVLYRIRTFPTIDIVGLIKGLEEIGIKFLGYKSNWVIDAEWEGKKIDLMFPEGINE